MARFRVCVAFDQYLADIDGFWVDLTGMHSAGQLNKWQLISLESNRRRHIAEYSFANNKQVFTVFLPCAPAPLETVSYEQFIQQNPSVCCTRPDKHGIIIGPDPILCPVPSPTFCDTAPPFKPDCPEVVLS